MSEPLYIDRGADFSAESPIPLFRYTLWRAWATGPSALFIMLNPSTADAQDLDPTLRRCCGFSQDLGMASFTVCNLFAYRTAYPIELFGAMRAGADVVGPENDRHILWELRHADLIIAGWGPAGGNKRERSAVRSREVAVLKLADKMHKPLHVLSLTKNGTPGHPLYLPRTCTPQQWYPR